MPRAALRWSWQRCAHRNRRKHTAVDSYWRDGRPWRSQAGYPIEQGGGVARHARRWRERSRIIGYDAIDDCEARVGISAVAGVDMPVNRRGEDDATTFLQRDKRIAP